MKDKWKKRIYIASKLDSDYDDYGNEITNYATPIEYQFNVQPISSEADIEEFGENAKQMQKAIIDKTQYEGIFKEFDKAYLDGANPVGEIKNGANANYKLYPPRNQNKVIAIYFERLTAK